MIKIVTILNEIGKEQVCLKPNCFEWKYQSIPNDGLYCQRCSTRYPAAEKGFVEGPYPRPGNEYVDRANDIQRYAFLFSRDGKSIQKTPMSSGLYIDGHTAVQLVDEAQNEINALKARINVLELQLGQKD